MRVVYRRARDADDRNFAAITWRASFRRSPYGGLTQMSRWVESTDADIALILAKPRVNIMIAADPDAKGRDADLFGHIVWEAPRQTGALIDLGTPPLIYFLYVKHDYRGNGFARGLMRAAGIDAVKPYNFVCRTHAADSLRDAGKMPRARWRPLLGRVTEGARDEHARDEAADPAA